MTIVARSAASRPPRRRRHVLVIVVALAVIAEVAIGVSLLGSRATPSPRTYSRAPALHPTERSAISMAVTALYDLSIPAIVDRARFEAAVIRLAAPGFDREVADAFGTTGAELAVSFRNGPRVLRAAPLGYRVIRYTRQSASIAIWSVAIAASRGFDPSAQWRTVVIDLAWTRRGWKVTGGSGTAGPNPGSPLSELAAEASTFRSLTHAP